MERRWRCFRSDERASASTQVGPATFFSAKQFEVFDVELLAIKSCTRSTSGMFSTVSCN